MTDPYPRNLVGYGGKPPVVSWPNGARIAVSFVLNYEEGGERTIMDGDAESESYLAEMYGLPGLTGRRNQFVYGIIEYGSRAGL